MEARDDIGGQDAWTIMGLDDPLSLQPEREPDRENDPSTARRASVTMASLQARLNAAVDSVAKKRDDAQKAFDKIFSKKQQADSKRGREILSIRGDNINGKRCNSCCSTLVSS